MLALVGNQFGGGPRPHSLAQRPARGELHGFGQTDAAVAMLPPDFNQAQNRVSPKLRPGDEGMIEGLPQEQSYPLGPKALGGMIVLARHAPLDGFGKEGIVGTGKSEIGRSLRVQRLATEPISV